MEIYAHLIIKERNWFGVAVGPQKILDTNKVKPTLPW